MEKTLQMHLKDLREQIAQEIEAASNDAVFSNEYNFNDTAVRAKTFLTAANIIRGKNVNG